MPGTFIEKYYKCSKCGLEVGERYKVEERDYEGSMDACMELLEDFLFEIGNHGKSHFAWLMRGGTVCTEKAETPQLAIIKAYLKSKGVTLEESND
jgi:hypothetical protein